MTVKARESTSPSPRSEDDTAVWVWEANCTLCHRDGRSVEHSFYFVLLLVQQYKTQKRRRPVLYRDPTCSSELVACCSPLGCGLSTVFFIQLPVYPTLHCGCMSAFSAEMDAAVLVSRSVRFCLRSCRGNRTLLPQWVVPRVPLSCVLRGHAFLLNHKRQHLLCDTPSWTCTIQRHVLVQAFRFVVFFLSFLSTCCVFLLNFCAFTEHANPTMQAFYDVTNTASRSPSLENGVAPGHFSERSILEDTRDVLLRSFSRMAVHISSTSQRKVSRRLCAGTHRFVTQEKGPSLAPQRLGAKTRAGARP